jgi:hypothetical protein
MTIYLVIDEYDETYTHNIDATFLSEEQAKKYMAGRAYSWHRLHKLEVTE